MRLRQQHLTDAPLSDLTALVHHLGAVQAQDYAGAKWALAQRLGPVARRGARSRVAITTDAELDERFDRGEILRTHVLRPTWHFVTPADIGWMLALTGPRILQGARAAYRTLGFDGKTLDRALTALQRAMEGGRHLTRAEIRAVLARVRVPVADTRRFAYLMLFAELQGLVCSGARRGKQHTHALLAERAPNARPLARADAVRELVRRYFASHGPATLHDFTVWSGLTVADARAGLEANGDAFIAAELDGRPWYLPAGARGRGRSAGTTDDRRSVGSRRRAHLLPNYDEYFIGFRHREPILARLRAHRERATVHEWGAHVITVDGQVVGWWRRTLGGATVAVALAPVVPLTSDERAAVVQEVKRFGQFLGLTPSASWG